MQETPKINQEWLVKSNTETAHINVEYMEKIIENLKNELLEEKKLQNYHNTRIKQLIIQIDNLTRILKENLKTE